MHPFSICLCCSVSSSWTPVSIGSLDMKTAPELDLISCPESRDAGTTSSRPGARLTRWVGRASFPFYWLVTFILVQHGAALAAEKTDPALVPSIFSPESAPAHAISHLAGFVLVITASIFIVVAGFLFFLGGLFCSRRQDDENQTPPGYRPAALAKAWANLPPPPCGVPSLTTTRP